MTEKEHLNQLRDGVEEATERMRALTDGLTERQLLWKPDPDRWSVAECLEHLILTGEEWHEQIEEALEEATPEPSQNGREYRPTLLGNMFLGLAGRKVRIPLKTGPDFRPGDTASADVPTRFIEHQEELLQIIDRAEGVDLRATVVRFPFTRLLWLRLGQALTLLVDHQHRHLRQAEEILQKDAFPSEVAV